ncbi:MAG: cytochrome C peroxidase [Sphingobacteriales bacterium]|nr:MAG: cytochrome C peroxidase [Sphingobacteriales bacterium]
MKRKLTLSLLLLCIIVFIFSFKESNTSEVYISTYNQYLNDFKSTQQKLLEVIAGSDLQKEADVTRIKEEIAQTRRKLKAVDFWYRYLEPLVYKKMNGPLPVEWETEVFEKFEKPYKRECAGLTLATLYLDEETPSKDSLYSLIKASLDATAVFAADSITRNLYTHHHFFLCNRLHILNLAAIYTTGFECPDGDAVIPELRAMMEDLQTIYSAYNKSYPETALPESYLQLYAEATAFVKQQPDDNAVFDHFTFIRDYVNPLFLENQRLINKYKVVSRNLIDYALNKNETTIFDKALYNGQNPKGIFSRVRDEKDLAEIDRLGKLLFYDPILSGNNLRSCASCHKPTEFFTDTLAATAFHFNRNDMLPRNTPSLVNAQYNHLIMADGKHYTLQHQTKDVMANPLEMGCDPKEMLAKVLSCDEYRKSFEKLVKYTPQEPEISVEHISSAITFYYSKFSKYYAPFDEAVNGHRQLDANAKAGFNLFMSKAQCATCHFVPQFNGVKPPYIGSEFEVLGTPKDITYKELSTDKGRYEVNPAKETMNAFRTGTVRNSMQTKPYMHNGVFKTMEQVVDFYDAGGGAGHGLNVANQTLSSDSLRLTAQDKTNLIAFIQSLNEQVLFEAPPKKLPGSKMKELNTRKVGGVY